MNRVVVVTGADRGLGLAMVAQLAEQGNIVFAGQFMPHWSELTDIATQYPECVRIVPLNVASLDSVQEAVAHVKEQVDHVDVLINNAGVNSLSRTQMIADGLDYDEMHRLYDVNSLGALRMVETFMPLLECGNMKRLCFVSSEAGSITRARRDAWYCYMMSKAALNMGVKIMFNDLRPKGYAFRLYHPGGIKSYIGGTDVKGTKASMEPEDAAVPALAYFLGDVENEDDLVMRDHQERDWPW